MCVMHDTCGIRVVWIKGSGFDRISYKALLHPLLEPAWHVNVLLTRVFCCAAAVVLLHVANSSTSWSGPFTGAVWCARKCWGVTGITKHGPVMHQVHHGVQVGGVHGANGS
jgi:hypothetical protein